MRKICFSQLRLQNLLKETNHVYGEEKHQIDPKKRNKKLCASLTPILLSHILFKICWTTKFLFFFNAEHNYFEIKNLLSIIGYFRVSVYLSITPVRV